MKDVLHVRIESEGFGGQAVEVYKLEGREELGRLFEFEVSVASKAGLDDKAVRSHPAELVFSRGDKVERRVFGMVHAIEDDLHAEATHLTYTLSFVPRAWRMGLTTTSEVFLDVSVPAIVQTKLERAGLQQGKDFELRLLGNYPEREFVMQYQETDLQFVSRLAEHLGITLFFEHRDERDVIVFSDENSGFRPLEGSATLPFSARGEQTGVFGLKARTQTLPARYVVKDYNYRTPQVSLLTTSTVADGAGGDVYEYGVHVKTPAEGQRIAEIRAQEQAVSARVFEGKSDLLGLAAGGRCKIEGHPRVENELLLVAVSHRAEQVVFGSGTGAESTYSNEFRAISAASTFRPARRTPKPKIYGAISGVIEAAQEGQYAELDDDGRYHVRFMFDMGQATRGRASRLIRMAQPHAGPGYGFHFPLRDGVEVALTFIDGDPDRPLITGAVPNPVTPSPVASGNGMRNVIRTGGGTEVNIDDNEGSARFKVTVPFGGTTLQLGSPNLNGRGVVIDTGENILISAQGKIDIISMTNAYLYGASQARVESKVIDIHAEGHLTADAPLIDVTGGTSISASAPEITITGGTTVDVVGVGTASMSAGVTATVDSGAVTIVHAGAQVTIASGGAVSVKAAAAVQVEAPNVTINGAGVVNVNGGEVNLNC